MARRATWTSDHTGRTTASCGYSPPKTSKLVLQVLQQCNGDLSRDNVMKQAENVHDLMLPTILPGIKASTRPTDHRPIKAKQLDQFGGKTWVLFGAIIEAGS